MLTLQKFQTKFVQIQKTFKTLVIYFLAVLLKIHVIVLLIFWLNINTKYNISLLKLLLHSVRSKYAGDLCQNGTAGKDTDVYCINHTNAFLLITVCLLRRYQINTGCKIRKKNTKLYTLDDEIIFFGLILCYCSRRVLLGIVFFLDQFAFKQSFLCQVKDHT